MPEIGHNGGPPLDDHVPEWGPNGIGVYFDWKRAHDRVWKNVSWDTMLRRQRRAEAIGLTYEEYTLELLERGRHLGPDDAERIAAIKAARPPLALVEAQDPSARVATPPRRDDVPDRLAGSTGESDGDHQPPRRTMTRRRPGTLAVRTR